RRGFHVIGFVTIAPSLLRSISFAYSPAKPKIPDAPITGLAICRGCLPDVISIIACFIRYFRTAERSGTAGRRRDLQGTRGLLRRRAEPGTPGTRRHRTAS